MKIKEGLDFNTSDFWYDLFEGGYIEPEDFCIDIEDAKKLDYAIVLLSEFREAIEQSYPDCYY